MHNSPSHLVAGHPGQQEVIDAIVLASDENVAEEGAKRTLEPAASPRLQARAVPASPLDAGLSTQSAVSPALHTAPAWRFGPPSLPICSVPALNPPSAPVVVAHGYPATPSAFPIPAAAALPMLMYPVPAQPFFFPMPIFPMCFAPPANIPPSARPDSIGDEPPAKRRRTGEAEPVPPSPPVPVKSASLPVPALRPQAGGRQERPVVPAGEPRPGSVSENYAIEGVTDADLLRCVQWLGLEPGSGMKLIKIAFVKYRQFDSTNERFEVTRQVLGLLDLTAKKNAQETTRISQELLVKLVASTACFLNSSYAYFVTSREAQKASALCRLSLGLLGESQGVSSLLKKHALFETVDDYKFVGGKARFEFILWCHEKDIRLSASELDALHMKKMVSSKNYLKIYTSIKSAEAPDKKDQVRQIRSSIIHVS